MLPLAQIHPPDLPMTFGLDEYVNALVFPEDTFR